MTTLQYVKRKGTCLTCKTNDPDQAVIKKGALYWLVEGGVLFVYRYDVCHGKHHMYA